MFYDSHCQLKVGWFFCTQLEYKRVQLCTQKNNLKNWLQTLWQHRFELEYKNAPSGDQNAPSGDQLFLKPLLDKDFSLS